MEDFLNLQRKNVSQAQRDVEKLGSLARLTQARLCFDRERVFVKKEIKATNIRLHDLGESLERLLQENDALDTPTSVIDDDEAKKYNETNGTCNFLLKISQSFEKIWNFIRSKLREKLKIESGVANCTTKVRQHWNQHIGAVATLAQNVTEPQSSVMALMHNIENLPRYVAYQNIIDENNVYLAVRGLKSQEVSVFSGQLMEAIDRLRVRG